MSKFNGTHWSKMPNAEEIRERISLTKTGKKLSPELCKKWSEVAKKNGNGKWMLGKKLSIKTKSKISSANSGDKAYQWKGGLPKCIKCNKTLSTYKSKICIKCRDLKGKNNPAWNGGITPEKTKIRNSIQYALWRSSVFSRDSWVCQECFIKGGSLNAHHIKPFSKYPELRFALDNGITLCKKCHRNAHKNKVEHT